MNFLTDHLTPKFMTKQEIEDACQKDAEIQDLIRLLELTAVQEKRRQKTLTTHEMNISILPHITVFETV